MLIKANGVRVKESVWEEHRGRKTTGPDVLSGTTDQRRIILSVAPLLCRSCHTQTMCEPPLCHSVCPSLLYHINLRRFIYQILNSGKIQQKKPIIHYKQITKHSSLMLSHEIVNVIVVYILWIFHIYFLNITDFSDKSEIRNKYFHEKCILVQIISMYYIAACCFRTSVCVCVCFCLFVNYAVVWYPWFTFAWNSLHQMQPRNL
jgi:hypothetical protein